MAEKVARKCACTGVLEADPSDPDDVQKAVQEHQAELRHRAWWAGAVMRGEYLPTEAEAKVGIITYKPVKPLLRRINPISGRAPGVVRR